MLTDPKRINMKDACSFLFCLVAMWVAFYVLHALINYFEIAGTLALMLFCLPMILFIAYATHEPSQNLIINLLKTAAWFYLPLLAIVGVVMLI